MAPPPSTVVSPVIALVIRVVTLVFLVVSVIVMATTTATAGTGLAEVKVKFNDFYAYRYVLAAGVIGIGYTLLQTAFTIFQVSTGNRLGGDGFTLLDFYGDKALSYMLATGAAAGFGLTVDLNRGFGSDSDTQSFLNKANAAAALLLIAFVFSAVSSVFSSFSLPKRT
ncbi:UNVERIFIED_CONTAM: CASP-like protein PIMP1 [Sesamum angustifolium]|uniref:CASP-like protein n=1 Tax=Sesamum angustifolium TaxID=2727405 RepID=A0AAW2NZA5_9LAMI